MIANKLLKFLKAFSLIELLIGMIAVSIITTAMAPVITKKIKSSKIIYKADQLHTLPFCGKFSPKCLMCYTNECLVCDEICSSGYVQDKKACKCRTCKELTGTDNCANCTFETRVCNKCNSGYWKNGSTCTICPKGYKCDGLTKTACNSGKFQANTGRSTCDTCPTGTYSPTSGAIDVCTNCYNGKHQATAGKTSCDSCAAGSYTPNTNVAHTNCIPCPAGQYTNAAGKNACSTCDAGTYNTGEGNTTCSNCGAGYACSGGSSRVACKTGDGNYANGTTASSCSNCGNGAFATDANGNWNGNYNGTKCNTCTAGWYCTGGYPRACGSKQYAKAGATACTNCHTSCQDGLCSSTTGVCTSCAMSSYVNGTVCSACINGCAWCSNNTTCDTCHWGYWRNSSLKCEGCPAGHYCRDNAKNVCPAGSYCPAGSNLNTACPAGQSSSAGAAACSNCAAGTYASSSGSSSCATCSAGTYSTGGATTCSTNTATGCATKSTTSNTCATCATGYYKSGSSCLACKAGCYTCSNGTTCTSCAANYHMTKRNGDTCVSCPSDATSSAGNKYEFCEGPPTKAKHCVNHPDNPWHGKFTNHGWYTASIGACMTDRVIGDGEIGDT